MTPDLVEYFSTIDDPRIDRNKYHALTDILVLTVCAVVSGADGWEAVVAGAKPGLFAAAGKGSRKAATPDQEPLESVLV